MHIREPSTIGWYGCYLFPLIIKIMQLCQLWKQFVISIMNFNNNFQLLRMLYTFFHNCFEAAVSKESSSSESWLECNQIYDLLFAFATLSWSYLFYQGITVIPMLISHCCSFLPIRFITWGHFWSLSSAMYFLQYPNKKVQLLCSNISDNVQQMICYLSNVMQQICCNNSQQIQIRMTRLLVGL